MKNVPVILIAVLIICFVQKTNAQKISRSDVRGVLYVAGVPFTGSFSTFCKLEGNCPSETGTKRFIILPNFGVPNSVKSLISVSIYLQEISDRRWYRVAFIQKQDLYKLGEIVSIVNNIEDRVVVSGSNNVEILFHKTITADALNWVRGR